MIRSMTSVAVAVTVASLALIPIAAHAQTPSLPTEDFARAADALLNEPFSSHEPGAAAIVTRDGRVIYAGAQGVADIETGRMITPTTPFLLGSVAKQFTAAIVLQLVAEGKISLDDPLSRFFPDWPKPGSQATVRQLLNHTSGLQDYTKVPGWIAANRDKIWTTEQLLEVALGLPAKAPPGTRWEYNNGGYMVLGAIVEKVTGKPWSVAFADRIARPLELTTIAPLTSDRSSDIAVGHSVNGDGVVPVRRTQMSIAHAAGDLTGSVVDVAKWANALHGGRVVAPHLYREMTSPARLADGSTSPYGFGFRLRQLRGSEALVHGGAGAGIDTDTIYIPSERIFAAVFSNTDRAKTDASDLNIQLAARALGRPFAKLEKARVEPTQLEPLFGTYEFDSEEPLHFFSDEGSLFASRGKSRMHVLPAANDRFFLATNNLVWFQLTRQADGAHVMHLHQPQSAEPVRGVRTGPAPAPFAISPAILRTYIGTYKTETVTLVVLMTDDGSLLMAGPGDQKMELRPVSDVEFRIDGTPMRVVFHPEEGRVDRFTMYRGARELHGVRQPE